LGLIGQHNRPALRTCLQEWPLSFANCSVALRSSSGSVRCIKHHYPDHRDKSERQKRGQRHKLLPVGGLCSTAAQYICDGHHSSLPRISALFSLHCPSPAVQYLQCDLGPLNERPSLLRKMEPIHKSERYVAVGTRVCGVFPDKALDIPSQGQTIFLSDPWLTLHARKVWKSSKLRPLPNLSVVVLAYEAKRPHRSGNY